MAFVMFLSPKTDKRIMLFFLTALFLTANAEARVKKTIIPGKASVPLHYVYNVAKWAADQAHVTMKAPVLTHRDPDGVLHGQNWWHIQTTGAEVTIDKAAHDYDQKMSRSVLVATTGTGTAQGTGVYLGDSLVLTNAHVLAWQPKDGPPQCRKFSVLSPTLKTRVACKTVKFCSPTEDYCVIEMGAMTDGKSMDSTLPSLQLRQTRVHADEELTIIGNSSGLGFLSSSAPGARYSGKSLIHLTECLSGNSGSPLFDQNGYLIGLHSSHTGRDVIDPDAENIAIPTNVILSEIAAANPTLYQRLKVIQLTKEEIAQTVRRARPALANDRRYDLDYAGKSPPVSADTSKTLPPSPQPTRPPAVLSPPPSGQ